MRWGRRHGPFDLALGHGSNDVAVAARVLRIPGPTMFDYEWATVQHNDQRRLARRSSCPRRSRRSAGALRRPRKLRRYPGLKEEYYLADFEPDPAVLAELGLDREQQLAVVRTPPGCRSTTASRTTSSRVLARLRRTQTVVLPRIAGAACRSWTASSSPRARSTGSR